MKEARTMKVALYGWNKYPDWRPLVHEWPEHFKDEEALNKGNTDTHRVSDWVTVQFQPRTHDEIVQAETASLEQARAETTEKFMRELKAIDERLAELRALPAPAQPEQTDVDDPEQPDIEF